MRDIFVDSWGWIALVDHRSPYCAPVGATVRDLQAAGVRLVTTNAVVYECITVARSRAGHLPGGAVLDMLLSAGRPGGSAEIVRADEALEAAAAAIFRRYDDKDFSFVDCLSFAVMQQRDIATALTGDKHFAQMGFEVLP